MIVEATASTNDDLLRAAPTLPSGAVLAAEYQSAGRGRQNRTWTSPARAGLTFSVLLRPDGSAWSVGVAAAARWRRVVRRGARGHHRRRGAQMAQ